MKQKKNPNIYKQVQRLADVTKKLIISGNIPRAKRCMQVAEDLLFNGNKEIKNAIVNVYVFSVSSFMELRNCKIKGLFPKGLQTEYHKQVNRSGI